MQTEILDYYDVNLSLLKKHHHSVWEIITKQDLMPTGKIFLSPNGKVNLEITNSEGNRINLHDYNNPEKEVPLFLDMIQKNSTGVVVLIGMGLGYTPLSIFSQRDNIRHLVVFESDPGIFVQALRYMDMSSLLPDPRLILSIGADPNIDAVFAPASRALKLEQIHMLQHIPSLTLDKNSYQKLYDLALSCANQSNIGGATTFKFGHEFINNRFTHLSSLHHNCLLENLKGKFSNIPAIMVAGGPSLDKNIHLLKKFKNKAVIIAVDSVLPTLLSRDITPDFVTSIDPQEMTYEKFANVIPQIKGVPFLICSAWVHPKIPNLFPTDQVFWSFSGNALERWFNAVAHMNLIAAIIMGCSPIVFVGQDLAFSEGKDHAGDVVLTDQEETKRIMNSKDSVWVDGINGGKVLTSRGLLSTKPTFERMIKNDPCHYINATEGGAHIEGTEVLPLQDVFDQYCNDNHNITSILKERSICGQHIVLKRLLSKFQSVVKIIKNLRRDIKKSDSLSHHVQITLAKLKESNVKYNSFNSLPVALKQKSTEIDVLHKRIDKENQVWKTLEDITMEGLRQSERILHKINSIKDNSERYLDWFSLNMKRLDLINNVRTNVLDIFEAHIKKTLNHHNAEKKLMNKFKKYKKSLQTSYDLVQFYFDNGNYMLAKQMLKQLDFNSVNINKQNYAGINYFRGAIAAYQTDHNKSETLFQETLAINPEFEKQINDFRLNLGSIYFQYAQNRLFDKSVSVLMLLKGLRYYPKHENICQKLNILFSNDVKTIEDCFKSNEMDKIDIMSEFWYKHLEENTILATIFKPKIIFDLYNYYGKRILLNNDLPMAEKIFMKAVKYTNDNPDIYVQITEVLFAQNKFDKGVEFLNKAVSLNRNYAVYWGNIGDNLQKTGQVTDAIVAYEQCFKALPERIEVLKKMGDCYRILEQYEAASEAYKQFKNLSEKHMACVT